MAALTAKSKLPELIKLRAEIDAMFDELAREF
jgi:hypothetical protein